MADWPDGLQSGPIREWPGTLRAPEARERAKFMRPGRWRDGKWIPQSPVPLTRTLADLRRELEALRAIDPVMLIAVDPGQFRIDGRPYAKARPEHPGVILTFEIPKIGTVSYPCDKYTRWEDNLRAIVLSLEALRLVDRHGVTRRGEQYRGFLAIEATAAPAGFATAAEAQGFLEIIVGTRQLGLRQLLREAQRQSHPDHGGDASVFQRVSLAEAKLRQEGML